ncbi:glycosyl transferase [Thioclava dalianensis]|uniref:Glycosyl transferase n=1 Tax=Thioclava dalianensis TaxID=1185766 RepID=A0A074T969_9RHOB|nr:hypothetical protein [Thioclava dalianensis]KEP68229.1 glycosyl transferase [Thioclava dalianensis]SFM92192.1 hypothetical protein SAMN05216224_101934 [Thioclava dalianensis]
MTVRSDRPFARRMVKLGFSLFAGRARAHGQDLWPGLRLVRDANGVGHGIYKGREAVTLQPAHLPAGLPEITLIGSGPSLKSQDLTRLPERSAILLNGAISVADRIAPLAIAVEDERFVWRHAEMLRTAPADCLWLLSPGAIRALLSLHPDALRDRRVGLIDNILKPAHARRRSLDDPTLGDVLRRDGEAALSRDPARGVVPAGTVAFSALQFALAARPAKIGFAGIDLGNANSPRFYETEGHSAASGIVSGLDRILSGFALARSEAEAQGIALACYSQVSALLEIGYQFSNRLD